MSRDQLELDALIKYAWTSSWRHELPAVGAKASRRAVTEKKNWPPSTHAEQGPREPFGPADRFLQSISRVAAVSAAPAPAPPGLRPPPDARSPGTSCTSCSPSPGTAGTPPSATPVAARLASPS